MNTKIRSKTAALAIFLFLTAILGTGCKATITGSGVKATEALEMNLNLKGRTVTVGYPPNTMIPDPTNPKNDIFTKMMLDKVKTLENSYNCRIQFKQYGEADFESVKSGSSDFDIFFINVGSKYRPPQLARENIALPLDGYLAFEGTALGIQHESVTIYNGQHYGIVGNQITYNNSLLQYNKTLLLEKGFQDPYELMIEGNWTWEKFKEMAAACTGDTDGDGIIDRWGMYLPIDSLVYRFAVSNNSDFIENINDKYTYALDSANGIEAVSFLNLLYNEDKVIMDYTVAKANAKDPAALAAVSKFKPVFVLTIVPVFSIKDGIEYGTVMFPKGPRADRYAATGNGLESMYIVTSSAKDPQIIAKLMSDLVVYWDPNQVAHITLEDEVNAYMTSGLQATPDASIKDKLAYLFGLKSAKYFNAYSMDSKVGALLSVISKNIVDSVIYKKIDAATYLSQSRSETQALIDIAAGQ